MVWSTRKDDRVINGPEAISPTPAFPPIASIERTCQEVRNVSISEVGPRKRHVRFPPVSDQTADVAGGPFRARSGSSDALQLPDNCSAPHDTRLPRFNVGFCLSSRIRLFRT